MVSSMGKCCLRYSISPFASAMAHADSLGVQSASVDIETHPVPSLCYQVAPKTSFSGTSSNPDSNSP